MQIRWVRAPLATLAAILAFTTAPLYGLTICFGENGHVAIEFPVAPGAEGASGAASADACDCTDPCGPCRDARLGPGDRGARLVRPGKPDASGPGVGPALPLERPDLRLSIASAHACAQATHPDLRSPRPQRSAILLI